MFLCPHKCSCAAELLRKEALWLAAPGKARSSMRSGNPIQSTSKAHAEVLQNVLVGRGIREHTQGSLWNSCGRRALWLAAPGEICSSIRLESITNVLVKHMLKYYRMY